MDSNSFSLSWEKAMNKMQCFVSFTGFIISTELRIEIETLCHVVQLNNVHKLAKPLFYSDNYYE